jgi:hypothetical protein
MILDLYVGRRKTGIYVEIDAVYPKMWRIRKADELSDMVNLTRARDAARSWARPDGTGGIKNANWKRRQSRPEASPVR